MRKVSDSVYSRVFWNIIWLRKSFPIIISKLLKLVKSGRCMVIMFFLFAIVINAYPISRAAGAFYQSARGNGLVKVNKIQINITQDNISFKGWVLEIWCNWRKIDCNTLRWWNKLLEWWRLGCFIESGVYICWDHYDWSVFLGVYVLLLMYFMFIYCL